jgi:cold shock CspA family protein
VVTRTSQDLLEEVSYPVAMHEIIENRVRKNESLINNLFVPDSPSRREESDIPHTNERKSGAILSLKNGYGFIQFPPNNLFFHYSDVVNVDFNELTEGDMVDFNVEKNERGFDVATNVEKTH